MPAVALQGRAVRLREFRLEDTAASLSVVGDSRVTQWLSFDNRDEPSARRMIEGTIDRAADEPRAEFYLAVTLDDDQLIGFARLGLNGVKAAKLGYAISADHWGHGYATDAARTMVEFAFGELQLHRVSAAIGPDNGGSIRVVERLGMQYEGRIRDHVFTNGGWRDSLLYSLLATDPRD